MNHFWLYALLLLTISCNKEQREIRSALKMAGDNRPELEAVLTHYASTGETEKVLAARYLIRHMPWHRSYEGDFGTYHSLVDSLVPLMSSAGKYNQYMAIITDSLKDKVRLKSDVQIITADFLTASIDDAFDLWKDGRWAAHLSFNEFCEYLLPYKVDEYQPLEEWRREYRGLFSGQELIVDDAVDEYRGEPDIGLQNIRGTAKGHVLAYSDSLDSTVLYDLRVLKDVPYGDCVSLCNLGLLLYRSKGLPVAMDYVPGWADRAGSHAWMSILTRRGVSRPIHAFSDGDPEDEVQCRRFAKVYRRTFQPNRELLRRVKLGYPIPASLKDFFFKDVTDEYVRCEKVTIKSRRGVAGRNVYAAIFDNQLWTPIAYGKREGLERVSFEKLARNSLYMPVVIKRNGEQVPIGDPFFIHTNGQVEHFSAKNSDKKASSVTMKRKYPVYWLLAAVYDRTRGGVIQCCENPDFRNPETIGHIPVSVDWSGYLPVSLSRPMRYFRFCASEGSLCDIAEIKLFNGSEYIAPSSVFSSQEFNKGVTTDPSAVIDDNALTWTTTDDNHGIWVGIDYGSPQSVTGVYYSVRSDGNDFYPGYEYVLRRWNGSIWEKVESFRGTKEVQHQFVSIPESSIFLITCSTTGTQSRPFVVKNGEVHWF